jgi:hypothetical protein
VKTRHNILKGVLILWIAFFCTAQQYAYAGVRIAAIKLVTKQNAFEILKHLNTEPFLKPFLFTVKAKVTVEKSTTQTHNASATVKTCYKSLVGLLYKKHLSLSKSYILSIYPTHTFW